MRSSTLAEIARRNPHDSWLQKKLAELEAEFDAITADRNRLIAELSRARTAINRLRAGLGYTPGQ